MPRPKTLLLLILIFFLVFGCKAVQPQAASPTLIPSATTAAPPKAVQGGEETQPTAAIPPTSTPLLPTHTISPSSTPTTVPAMLKTVKIASWGLQYDPDLWEVLQNPSDPAGTRLQLKGMAGCIIEPNWGFGPPLSWQRVDSEPYFGNAQVHVETWTDTITGYPVLIVYEYPPGKTENRVELMMMEFNGDHAACIRETEKVITDSLN